MPSSGISKPAISRSVVVLPEPDGPEQREELALRDVEVDAVDRGEVAVALGQPAQPDVRQRAARGDGFARFDGAGCLAHLVGQPNGQLKRPAWTKRPPYLSAVERLFDPPEEERAEEPADGPLAARMRPRTLAEFVGQEHLLGEGSALRAVARVGPSRTRWSSTARPAPARRRWRGSPPSTPPPRSRSSRPSTPAAPRCARSSPAPASAARPHGRATILFLDEIHRFNKAQQDALLPAVEEGPVTLIGATTENPYFEVNCALLSRAQVYELQALDAARRRGAAAARARARRVRRRRASPTRCSSSSPRAPAATRAPR